MQKLHKRWQSEEEKLLEEWYGQNVTYKEIGKRLCRSEGAVREKIKSSREKGSGIGFPLRKMVPHPVTGKFVSILGKPIKVWDDFITYDCDNIMLTADWHIPYINIPLMETMINYARKLKIKTLAIIGDFLSLEVFSYWTSSKDSVPSFATELEILEKMLQIMFKWFEVIIIIPGNHERRFWSKLDGKDDFHSLMNYLCKNTPDKQHEKIILSYHSYVDIIDKISPYIWHLTHQKNYSKLDLVVPRGLANKISTKNIICAHTHHCCMGHADDGKRVIAEIGCMTEQKFFEYMMRVDTHSVGSWSPGFGILQKGKLNLISEGMGF